MRKTLSILLLLLTLTVHAETSTEGCDFWLTYMLNAGSLDTDNTLSLKVVIATDSANTIVVENPRTSFRRTLDMAAHSADTVQIPSIECYMMESGVVQQRAIHVSSRFPVTVYAASYGSASMDATFVLPTRALGKDYRLQTFPFDRQSAEFAIVATTDATTVRIREPESDGYTVLLQRGDSYLVRKTDLSDQVDLSGSVVCADHPIAIFSGNQAARVPHSEDLSDDHIYEQAVPTTAWGTDFVIPMVLRQQHNILRVTAAEDDTEIWYNGVSPVVLSRGETWEREMDASADSVGRLHANHPVACYLYMTSARYNVPASGDPSMLLVPPLSHTVPYQTFTTFSYTGLTDYLSVVVSTASAASLLLDGAPISAQPLAVSPEWSLYRNSLSSGVHTLSADEGFVSWVYGMSDTRSYGYASGFRAVDHVDTILLNHHYVESLTSCPTDTVWLTALLDAPADVRWQLTDSVLGETLHLTGEEVSTTLPERNAVWQVMMIATRYTNTCDWAYEDTTYARLAVPYAQVDDPLFYDHGSLHLCDTDRVAIDTLGLSPLRLDSTYLFIDSLRGVDGCDSIVRRRVWVHRCSEDTSLVQGCDTLRFTISVPDLCADDEWMMLRLESEHADRVQVHLLFSDLAHQAGFRDTVGTVASVPYYVRPNRYTVSVVVQDSCGSVYRLHDLPFTVLYPSWVVDQHWNDVLAILSDNYNGGYHFTSVEWYRNGEKLPDEHRMHMYMPHAVYTASDDTVEVYYQACLTRADDGYVGFTCPMVPQPVWDTLSVSEPYVSVAPTVVSVADPQVDVLTTTTGMYYLYSVTGRLLETGRYTPCEHNVFTLRLPFVRTMYLVQFVPDNPHPNNPKPVVKVLVR